MSEVLQANIFFVIASVATVAFFVVVCLVVYQIFKVVKTIRTIVERIDKATQVIASDAADLRASVKQGGWFGRLASIIMGAASKKTRRK